MPADTRSLRAGGNGPDSQRTRERHCTYAVQPMPAASAAAERLRGHIAAGQQALAWPVSACLNYPVGHTKDQIRSIARFPSTLVSYKREKLGFQKFVHRPPADWARIPLILEKLTSKPYGRSCQGYRIRVWSSHTWEVEVCLGRWKCTGDDVPLELEPELEAELELDDERERGEKGDRGEEGEGGLAWLAAATDKIHRLSFALPKANYLRMDSEGCTNPVNLNVLQAGSCAINVHKERKGRWS